MSQMQNVLLFSTASFLVLLFIVGMSGTTSQQIIPPGFTSYILQHSWFTSRIGALSNLKNATAQNVSAALFSYQNTSLNISTNDTTVSSFFGIDWSKLGAITGLLNIFAAASGFFISVFSFFAAPMLLVSLFRLPLIVVIAFDILNLSWWVIAIYGMFRGG